VSETGLEHPAYENHPSKKNHFVRCPHFRRPGDFGFMERFRSDLSGHFSSQPPNQPNGLVIIQPRVARHALPGVSPPLRLNAEGVESTDFHGGLS